MTIGAAALLQQVGGHQPVDVAIGARDVEIAHHQRERLARAALARAQAGHGVGVGRVAGELKAAEPLDRQDFPAHQQARRAVDRIERGDDFRAERSAVAAFEPGPRSAGGAGDRLGVEAAVVRRVVFAGAGGAQARSAASWWIARS